MGSRIAMSYEELDAATAEIASQSGEMTSTLADLRTQLDGLRITGFGPVPYQVDGDYLGEATELVFKHEPDAIRLVVP